MKPRAASPGETILGVAALVLFVAYFGAHSFRYPAVGDHHRHVASIASLYRDFLHPSHEAMPVPAEQSEVHTPYIVAVAGIGRLLGVTPYRALQLAGLANLVFYAWAIWFFFRTFSVLRRSWVVPAAFLAVSLFLRSRLFHWASETSFATLRWIQAYPSFFAWGAALTAFALAERFFRRPRAAFAVAIGFLVWVLLLSHSLTASWVIGILALRALLEAFRGAGGWKRAIALAGVVGGGALIALSWPYFDIRTSPGLLRIREGSEFGDHPFRDMAGLYAVALPAAAAFLLIRRHAFWIAAFLATFAALLCFRSLGFDYVNRYAFFQAFFAQALVAEAVGIAAAVARRRTGDVEGEIAPRLRAAFVLIAVAALAFTLASPVVRQERREGRPLLSFRELFERPSSHDEYYATLGEVGRHLDESDLVMMPVEHAAWDVAAITGARVVASLFSYRVPDYPERLRNVTRYFTGGTPAEERARIARAYGVTKVLVTDRYSDLVGEISRALGAPIARAGTLVLFDARSREESRDASERLRQRHRIAERPVVVQLGHRRRVAVAHQAPLVDPDRAVAALAHLRQRVGDEEHRLPRLPELLDPHVALPLEPLVAHGERLVHQEDVGLDVGRGREREPRRHAGGVRPDRRVDELLDLGPFDDPGHAPFHLRARASEERSLEHHVLATRQFAVEPEPQLEQGRDAPGDDHAARRRGHHPGDQTEERALARAVLPDHADRLAGLHFQAHVLQGLELVEEEASLESPDRVLLERADPLPWDPVAHRDLVEADRRRHAQLW